MVTGGRQPPSRKLSQSYRWSYAAGIVIGQPIQLYYPPITARFQTSPFTCVVTRRGQAAARTASIVIMWSRPTGESVLAVGPVAINHFVPLQRRAVPRVCDETVVVHSDNDDDDDRQSHRAEQNDIAAVSCGCPVLSCGN